MSRADASQLVLPESPTVSPSTTFRSDAFAAKFAVLFNRRYDPSAPPNMSEGNCSTSMDHQKAGWGDQRILERTSKSSQGRAPSPLGWVPMYSQPNKRSFS